MLLNRAISFKNARLDIRMSIGYLHDSGALPYFRDFISVHDLRGRIEPFVVQSAADSRLHSQYDLTLVIDTPGALPYTADQQNIYVECHTPYVANREYLRRIPRNVRGLIVPSDSFAHIIKAQFPHLPRVHTVSNPIPGEFFDCPVPGKKIPGRRPISYLARLDNLKNINEAFQVFRLLRSADDIMFFIVGQGAAEADTIRSLSAAGILGRTFLRESVPFDKVPALVGTVKAGRGVFFSPSKGESFGLSAAEFMAGGVPVLLSDIPAHRELVDGDERLLYPVGNTATAAAGIAHLLENWEEMSILVGHYASKFREERFLQQWKDIFGYAAPAL